MKSQYVLGLMFNCIKSEVVLIRKRKPKWQENLLNGVGGKIEQSESPINAMIREFKEEAGVLTEESDWRSFCVMEGRDFDVFCFTGSNQKHFQNAKTSSDEAIEKILVPMLNEKFTVSNLDWLIYLAADDYRGGRPPFARVYYS